MGFYICSQVGLRGSEWVLSDLITYAGIFENARAVILNQLYFTNQGTSGNVWKCFWLAQLGEGFYRS